jgi:tryptophan synthase alpha chain
MSRIAELFKKKSRNILNVYCTAGYPQLIDTVVVLEALQKFGADMVEIGMPYSDPLADGPIIQMSSTKALQNGMTVAKLFQQLKGFRDKPSLKDLPVVLMGYMNPVLQYGFEKFCTNAAAVGIDGLILPDLPEYEFETEYGAIVHNAGLDFIFLVTPETSDARVRRLDQLSSGFLYAVSSSSTTGKDKNIIDVKSYLQKLKKLQLNNPVLVGFGIKDRPSFLAACENANGAIIGTAFIKALENSTDIGNSTKGFLDSVIG